jgi:hypothetical protein
MHHVAIVLQRCSVCCLLVICALGSATPSPAAVLDVWHWRSPLPQGNGLRNVVFANGVYVAVGDLGTIITSSDGTNWQRRVSGVTDSLRDCAYGGGQYVAVGDYGVVLTSPDLATWTLQYADTFFALNGVTYGNGLFVAVGEETTICTSPNGIVWTQRGAGEWQLYDVAYGGGAFVAVGGKPPVPGSGTLTTVSVILSSVDGFVWTRRALTSEAPLVSVAYAAGTFAAVGGSLNVWSSTNLVDWQTTPSHIYPLTSISYGAGEWVAGSGYWGDSYYGPGHIYASEDLASWSEVMTNATAVGGIAFGNEKFIASTAVGTFAVSSNGLSWQEPTAEPIPFTFQDLKYLNGQFVGVGGKQLSFSADASTWTNTVTVTNAEESAEFLSITFGNGRYVAGGLYGTVWTSLDGLNWTNPAPDLGVSANDPAVVVAFGNGVFVGVSGPQAHVLTSPDGLNWTAQELTTNTSFSIYSADVTYGNGRFVAVFDSLVATSADGTNWISAPVQNPIYTVAAGNGKFVALGNSAIAVSTNGLDWTYQSSSAFSGLADVTFGAGFFVAVGYDYTYRSGHESPIWVSPDGTHWSKRASWTPRILSTVAFGDGTFVIGCQGGILQSDPLLNLELTMRPAPHLLLWGPVNRSYSIEFADAFNPLNNWRALTNVFADQCPMSISDTNGSGRFYRAALLPH